MGWARANLFFDKVDAPPSPGSLKEALCILIQRYRQEQDYYKLLASLSGGAKEKQEAFEKYRQAMFPYIQRGAYNEKNRIKDILDRAFLQGPLFIKDDKGKPKT